MAAEIPLTVKSADSSNRVAPALGDIESNGEAGVTASFLRKGEFLDGNTIGEKPQGRLWGWFFDIDPFKNEEYVRNARVHKPKKNIVFAIIYWLVLAGYTIFAFIAFIDRPPTETYSQTPMTKARPAELSIELECTTPWGCYNATGQRSEQWWINEAEDPENTAGSVDWLMIRQTYSDAGLAEGYCTDVQSFTEFVKTRHAKSTQNITLCYSRISSDGVDIIIPFPNDYEDVGAPSLNVRVLEGGEVGMEVEVSMEASQVKTITVGVDILRVQGEPETQELFRADMFYNAKRPYTTALLRIRLEHRAGVRTITRPGSVMDVLASAGGASAFLLSALTAIRNFDPLSLVATCASS